MLSRPVARPLEIYLAPQFPIGSTPVVKRVRSTLLAASLQAVRQMGWEERYFKALPRAFHDEMRLLTAGTWVPLELAVSHYTACDSMGLTSSDTERMGKTVSLRTQKTFVGTLGNMVASAGVTPWTLFANNHRIFGRMFEGGDQIVYKVGPKDALVVIMGLPLLNIDYFRTAIAAYYVALAGLVSRTVHSRDVPERRGDAKAAFRFSWV